MAIEWTKAEIQTILAGIELPAGVGYDWDEILRRIGDVIDVEGITEQMVAASVGASASPEILAAATANAERQTRRIAGNLARAELQKIAKTVRDNIEAGRGPLDIARELGQALGLDNARKARLTKYGQELLEAGITGDEFDRKMAAMLEKLKRERGKVVAITEQRIATEQGAAAIAEARGAKYKRWITVGDDRVSDMDQDNEAEGWVPFDHVFSSGDTEPPSHPNCRCTVAYRTTEPTPTAERQAERSAERTQEAKEKS